MTGLLHMSGCRAQVLPLVDSVTRSDVENVFSAFGKVADIEFKKRSNVHSAVITYVWR